MVELEQIKKIYRIVSWASFAGLAVIIVLVLRKSPTPQVPYDSKATARAEQKFIAAGQAANSGQPSQVQVDPTELNSYLKQNLQLAGSDAASAAADSSGIAAGSSPAVALPANADGSPASATAGGLPSDDQASIEQVQSSVKDVKVDMDGDLVKAYVIFNFHGKDLSLELDGHLAAQGGYIKFDPVAGKLGSLPLPQATLEAAVEKMMSSPENREKLRLPDNINDIQIQNGQAVVSYK